MNDGGKGILYIEVTEARDTKYIEDMKSKQFVKILSQTHVKGDI